VAWTTTVALLERSMENEVLLVVHDAERARPPRRSEGADNDACGGTTANTTAGTSSVASAYARAPVRDLVPVLSLDVIARGQACGHPGHLATVDGQHLTLHEVRPGGEEEDRARAS
jgi:hypothetical protein